MQPFWICSMFLLHRTGSTAFRLSNFLSWNMCWAKCHATKPQMLLESWLTCSNMETSNCTHVCWTYLTVCWKAAVSMNRGGLHFLQCCRRWGTHQDQVVGGQLLFSKFPTKSYQYFLSWFVRGWGLHWKAIKALTKQGLDLALVLRTRSLFSSHCAARALSGICPCGLQVWIWLKPLIVLNMVLYLKLFGNFIRIKVVNCSRDTGFPFREVWDKEMS